MGDFKGSGPYFVKTNPKYVYVISFPFNLALLLLEFPELGFTCVNTMEPSNCEQWGPSQWQRHHLQACHFYSGGGGKTGAEKKKILGFYVSSINAVREAPVEENQFRFGHCPFGLDPPTPCIFGHL